MAEIDRFNPYVLRSVEKLARERAGLGYDIGSYFTRSLDYGGTGQVPANHPPNTMCVAAVSEVIIEALNLYTADTEDGSPFQKLPVKSWRSGSQSDIRAHIFMYEGTGSRGTAHALSRFGIGGEIGFGELRPGDFVNMNRASGSGHAAVFLGYINKDYGDEADFSNRVAGFKYFSAQGKGMPDAGFGYRWGFFEPMCPPTQADKRRDCRIIRSPDQKILNTGFMLHPRAWNVDGAIGRMRAEFVSTTVRGVRDDPKLGGGRRPDAEFEHLADEAFTRELKPSDLSRFDGKTTD